MIKELKDIAVWQGENMWLGIKSMPRFALDTPKVMKVMYEKIKEDIKVIIKCYKSEHS